MGKVSIRTEIPGPRAREWQQRREAAVIKAFSPLAPIIIEHATGATVTDVDGNTFIDFTGGIGCLNVGHTPPEVVEAVIEQTRKFLHTDFTVIPYAPFIELAERLSQLTPIRGARKAVFFNSGAEAVENSIKIARYATGKKAVIAFEGAFHGRTLLAMSLTSKIKPYKQKFGPFAPEVYRIPYANCYRCPYGLEYPSCGVHCAQQLERAFVTMVDPQDTAAVIVEPVQGEGGFVVPPPGFLPRIREITRKYGILLIADEVQTGFGRTGKMFAVENWGVEPDLVTVAKSIAAGLPLSGVVGRKEIMDAPDDGTIGGTFVGNPVACAAALKVLDVIENQHLLERSQRLGEYVKGRFAEMQKRLPLIGDVRGIGGMVAMELVKDRQSKEPATAETGRILARALGRGLILLKAGTYGNVIRVLAPLVTSEEELSEGLDILEGVITELS
ncbi:MAG: 4-aminobutyrate--2-oxoglutarate transaminase [Firmicutes bacterium]|nr:4-aminobutyrate--2-oxoglutarate transaminase [Bacillota bacterium]MCL5040426.1 4-aminobutyrate--2-oxoglutarate transaminase [Bacillota bacterium]